MGAGRSKETTCFGGSRARQHDSKKLTPQGSSEPIRVAVIGAAGQVGYALLPMIAAGRMFGPMQKVILQCLDLNLPEVRDNMKGIEMELTDANFPLLQEAIFSTEDNVAFKNADFAILLGAYPCRDGEDKRRCMEKNIMIFRTMALGLQDHAKKKCKVLIAGSPVNTNALIFSHFAQQLPKENVSALSRLDQNRALGAVAQRAAVGVSEVRNIIVWGSRHLLDLEHATVKGQAINSALSKEADQHWLRETLHQEVQHRGASITKLRKASTAMSSAKAIVDHIYDLHVGTTPGTFVSMAVWSQSNPYNLDEGIFYSMPVTCAGGGRYQVVSGLQLGPQMREKMAASEAEIIAERKLAEELFNKHPRRQ